MKKTKNNHEYRTTPKTAKKGDTPPIEESAIDTFLYLRSLEKESGNTIKIELLPPFIEDLALEIEELKKLRDQILQ